MGIRVVLEPEFQFAGELIFPDGRRHLFRNTNFNVNPAGSTEIAKDKDYTKFFLRERGFPVPDGRTFFSEKLNKKLDAEKRRNVDDAVVLATTLGFPVFVKPNNLSQGELVTKVDNPEQLRSVAKAIFEKTEVMLVERECRGRDYRIVVLDREIISAYERIPLCVTGDGKHTIQELIGLAQIGLSTQGRPNSEIAPDDVRIDLKLERRGLARSSVLTEDRRVSLLDNANLSTGGTSLDATELIHASFAKIAVDATKALGLVLAGVDIICQDLSLGCASQSWVVIEINAAPGLDNYSAIGEVQARRVKDLYRQILKFLERTTSMQ